MADHIAKILEYSELDIVLPQATDFTLQDLGLSRQSVPGNERDADDEDRLTNLASIPPRTSLHFDEQLSILVVLRTPTDLSGWEKRFPYLKINLEAHVYSSDNRSSDGQTSEGQSVQPQGRDIVWSGTVDTSQEPLAVRGEDTNAYASVWVVNCFLSPSRHTRLHRPCRANVEADRPRLRMEHPMIYFKVSGILRHPPISPRDSRDPFLPSGVAASVNVLEPLSGDAGLQGKKPQLPASRLDRININNNTTVKDQAIRSRPQKPLPALPAISARVRYSKSGAYTGHHCIIASLDVETAPFQDDKIELSDVFMQLSDGSVEDLCKGQAINLPMTCQPRDKIVFLFRLLPFDDQTSDFQVRSSSRKLDISINARVLVSPTCHPKIHMRWKTHVDFSTALNPKYGAPAQALQRSKRPSTLSVPSDMENRVPGETSPNDADDDSPPSQRLSIPNIGLTLTFTAPKDVHVGQPFTWDVFLVNHSLKPRRLAIFVIPVRRSGEHRNQTSVSSSAIRKEVKGGDLDYAEAIMDENRLYAVQKRLAREDVGIVCLSPEVRVGPVNPGFCHNTELKFLPLAKGVLHIEAVRVVDLEENRSVDVRDLPEIVAEERLADE
ncbi:MAG: hypothetical protein LQ345_006125 [Seirophora villosa]|nr:MAG: hypothetical protein LQ345_006125 [Seirophora villosa]